jgi:hypothetical protein
MDKYSRIQGIIEQQQKEKQKILDVFKDKFPNIDLNKIKIIFVKDEGVKIKILERSSLKFSIMQQKENILAVLQGYFPDKYIIID